MVMSHKYRFGTFWSQALNVALETIPKDRHGKVSKEYLRAVLDTVAPSASLPPIGAVSQVNNPRAVLIFFVFEIVYFAFEFTCMLQLFCLYFKTNETTT